MLSNHLILYHPLLFPPSIFPSIRVFSNESALHIRWPKYWSFSFSTSSSNEYSVNKGTHIQDLSWASTESICGSPRPPSRILKLLEGLTGFSHIHSADGLNNTLNMAFLKWILLWGRMVGRMYFPRARARGGKCQKPLIVRIQLSGPPVVMSSP